MHLNTSFSWGDEALALWVKNAGNVKGVNYDAVVTTYVGGGSFQRLLQAPRAWGLSYRLQN